MKWNGHPVKIVGSGTVLTLIEYLHLFTSLPATGRVYGTNGEILQDCRQFHVSTIELELENGL